MVTTSLLLSKINRRKIIKNFGQFISIIIITLLAVTLAVGLNSSAKTLEAKLDLLLDETNFADGIIYGDVNSFDTSQFDEYQKRLQLSAKTNDTNIDLLITDGLSTINTPYTDNYTTGVYITHLLAEEENYHVGDVITLAIDISDYNNNEFSILDSFVKDGKENFLNNTIINLEFTIKGLMYHAEGIVDTYPICMTYDNFTTVLEEKIIDNYSSSDIIISFLENSLYGIYNSILFKGDIDSISNIENYFLLDSQYISGVYQMRMDINQAYQLTYVFPVVFIIVSILIIITTISQLIFKERLNIATLKSIGISNKKIYSHYILLTISLCLIGGIIGAIIGPLIIPNVMGIKYDMIYIVPYVSNVYAAFPIISNILLFVIISTIVSYILLKSSVRMHPAQLIKHTGNHKFKKSKIDIKSWSTKIAFRNISQNRFRSLMVIIGVGGCAALFITGFGIDDTLSHTPYVDTEINFPADATITFNYYSTELKNEINNLNEISLYEEYVIKSSSIKSNIFNLTDFYFIDNNTQVFNSGNFNGIYVSSNIARKLELEVNDEIKFTINNIEYEFVIDYIIETGFTHGVFIPSNRIEESFVTTNAWINSNNFDKLKEYSEFDIYTKTEFLEMVDEAIGPISIIKVTLQVFACLLGVVVLFNLALLNFKEKSRDIATLKVLGLTNKEIAKSLIIEMMVLAVLGGLVGLALGYPLMVLLLSINEVEFITYIYNLRIISYIKTFIFTTLTALIINLILFQQIDKIKMVESLKSVE